MLRSSLVILLLALSASASAEGFNYSFVSAGYGTTDFDGIGDGDGFTLRGSYAFNNDIHGFAGYESAGLDFGIDATRWNAGFGYNTSMSDKLDLVARLSRI